MDIGQIQDVTDSLALMPDAALQKYAMMNKDDPYIMSLAMSENNRRKKMRTAQQGQAGQMPAPKVVDQAIQAINPPPPQAMPPQQGMAQAQTQLPEDQGIAQIPAPNMQQMADGGIAGYADRGLVEEYKYVRDPSGKLVKVPVVQETQKPGVVESLKKLMEYSNRNAANPAAMAPTAPPPSAASLAAPPAPAGPSMNPGNPLPQILQDKTPPPPPGGVPTGGSTMPGLSVAGLRNEATADEGRLQSMLTGARSDFEKRLPADAEAGKDLKYFIDQRKAQMPTGEAYDKYQASLEKEEAAEPAEREKAGLLSLTKGFLAVAAGKSPHALQNFAEGMGVGLDDYAGAIKEFRKAGKERQKQLGDIEQARRAEKRGDVDAAAGYMEKAKERESKRQSTLASGIAQLDATGMHGVAGLMSQTLSGRYNLLAAQTSASAPSAQQRHIQAAMANPAYAEMATKLASAGPETRGEFAQTKYWNSMEGQMALRMMEKSKDPDEQARAKAIKTQLKASSMSFTEEPTGPVRGGK